MIIKKRTVAILAAGTLAAFAAIAIAIPASAAPGFVQGRSTTPAGTATTASLAFTSNVVAGHLLVVIPSSWQSTHTTVSAVTDTLGDTWTKAPVASAGGQETELWYAFNSAGGADTVNVTWAASAYRALSIAEYSGASALEVSHGAGDASAGTSHSSGATTTPAAAGDLVIGGYGDPGTGGTITAGSGYMMATTDAPNTNMSVAAEHNLSLGTAGAVTATFTSSASAQAAAVVAAFTTSGGTPQAPVVTTNAATAIGSTTATLNGSVNPEGQATTYQFQYGTTTAYGTNVPSPAGSAGSGSTAVNESAAVTGLTASTLYHYRITATNATGTTNGADQTFTTSAAGNPTQLVCPVVNNPTSGQVITCTYQA